MLIVLLIIIIFLFMIMLFILSRSRVYIYMDWQWDEEDKCVQFKVSLLHITLYQETIDLTELDFPSLDTDNHAEMKEMYHLAKSVLKKSEIEKIDTETIVATYDPSITAYLYVSIITLVEWIRSHYSNKRHIQLDVSADFEQETFQSVGECMISVKMSKTIKGIKKMKKLRKESENSGR
ncbi:hypothetical protein SAMN04487943_107209 [Gracilibacillus orientalis]|uniref:Uncharacterized protein n=1 Tax=Gracilibacillus orientalis TaxID=334253 RepID=A0A1I4MYX8_9BACI|nr:hypothetical protein [Gracilibacillus orientalis]SFM08534.1 hypothetical protein SAMN04487943_107209 [Gracilibacillus orientalis]